MRLSDLTKETKKLSIVYKLATKDFPVLVEYRPQAVTIDFIKGVEGKSGTDQIVERICKSLVRWDLQDDDGVEIPVTKEKILEAGIPAFLLTSIIEEINADARSLGEAKNA